MEHVVGLDLLRVMLWQTWNILHFPTQMAETHARLPALPVEGFLVPAGPFLERWLRDMETTIDQQGALSDRSRTKTDSNRRPSSFVLKALNTFRGTLGVRLASPS
jgi:hypothetical protein